VAVSSRNAVAEFGDEFGVPALLVEKSLAIDGEDFVAMRDWASRATPVKIAVNHQLHFQPRRALLQERVMDGAIGEVRFVDASADLNLAYQGTHCRRSPTSIPLAYRAASSPRSPELMA
jgi:predicted dehydrogenase